MCATCRLIALPSDPRRDFKPTRDYTLLENGVPPKKGVWYEPTVLIYTPKEPRLVGGRLGSPGRPTRHCSGLSITSIRVYLGLVRESCSTWSSSLQALKSFFQSSFFLPFEALEEALLKVRRSPGPPHRLPWGEPAMVYVIGEHHTHTHQSDLYTQTIAHMSHGQHSLCRA